MPLSTKTLGPFTFAIDRPKGTVKEWPQPTGGVKRFVYPVDYGFLRQHTGEDGEGLDFFVGDDPDGHLESFQKLKRGDDGRLRLDETKFLVGVNDRDRETIYELYRTEVWHRKVYGSWAALQRDLPKFQGKNKARYGVPKTAGAQRMDMYEQMLLEKQAFSFSGALNHLGDMWQNLRGGQAAHMMPLSARKTQPWRRPIGRPPPGVSVTQVGSMPTMAAAVSGVQPRQAVSGVRPKNYTLTQVVPSQQPPMRSLMEHSAEPGYHPGQEGISQWLEQYDGPEAVRDDVWTHPGGWKQQGALMPENPGMRQAVLSQRGLWDTDRSIMAELGRQFEARHAKNPAEAKAYYQQLQGLGGNTPGWMAALQSIPQHYKMSSWQRKLAEEAERKHGLAPKFERTAKGIARVGVDTAKGLYQVGTQTARGLSSVVSDTYKDLHYIPKHKRVGIPKMLEDAVHEDKVAMLKLFGFKGSEEKFSDIIKDFEGPSRLIPVEMQKALNQQMISAPLSTNSVGERGAEGLNG